MVELLNSLADKWLAWQWGMFWQVGVLVAIVFAADVAIRRWAWPQVRYALWMLVALKLLIPPTLTSPASVTSQIPAAAQTAISIQFFPTADQKSAAMKEIPILFETIAPHSASNQKQTSEEALDRSNSSAGSIPERRGSLDAKFPAAITPAVTTKNLHNSTLSWKSCAMLLWTSGVVILSAWLLARLSGLRRAHYKLDKQSQLPPWFHGLMQSSAQRLGLKRFPRVILTDRVTCPAVFGVFRPVLLMPQQFKTMDRSDIEHILLHELAHIKRGDLLVHAIYMMLQIVYWFNPLLWMIRRTMQNLRELCCDATVARLLKEDTVHYRQTLLETARGLLAQPVDPGLGLLGLFENSNWLVTRLQWLEKKTWKNRPLRIATVIAMVSIMTVCVLPMAKEKPFISDDQTRPTEKWKTRPIQKTSLESFWGGWKNLPFELSANEEQAVSTCAKLCTVWYSPDEIRSEYVRQELEAVLRQQPDLFYAEYLLAIWHRDYGDKALSRELIEKAYEHAPVILAQKYQDENGKPIAGLKIQFYEIECNRVKKGYLNPDLQLKYRDLITDADGCIYVPVYDTVYRLASASLPDGCDLTYPTLGWFKAKSKIGLMPICTSKADQPGFNVTGTVTDAATGDPIAGADVYDHAYNNNLFRTTTDAHGKFLLKTFNEEHTIGASADGYQTRIQTLTTWPFANHKDFNFKLTALPSGIREAMLLPKHFESQTVLSLKTGQIVPQQQADGAKEPYLFYGYTFPPGANPSHYTVDTIPENCIGVSAGKMDLAGGGWGKDFKAAYGLWQAENLSQLPTFNPQRLKLTIGDQVMDGTFIVPALDTDWPYITAFRGDDGTYGVFETTKVQDRKIFVRFRTIGTVGSDQSQLPSQNRKQRTEAASGSDVMEASLSSFQFSKEKKQEWLTWWKENKDTELGRFNWGTSCQIKVEKQQWTTDETPVIEAWYENDGDGSITTRFGEYGYGICVIRLDDEDGDLYKRDGMSQNDVFGLGRGQKFGPFQFWLDNHWYSSDGKLSWKPGKYAVFVGGEIWRWGNKDEDVREILSNSVIIEILPVSESVALHPGVKTNAEVENQSSSAGSQASGQNPEPGWIRSDRPGAAENDIAFKFDGSRMYAKIAPNPVLDIRESLTLSAWVKNEGDDDGQILWRGDNQGGRDPYELHVTGSRMEFRINPLDGTVTSAVQSRPMDDRWHLWTGVYDSRAKSISLYKDGQLETTAETPVGFQYDTATMWNMIGAVDFGNWQHFKGIIDEARIWDRALAPAEIQQQTEGIYQPNDPNLVAYWSFNNDRDNTIHDASGHNNHGQALSWTGPIGYIPPQETVGSNNTAENNPETENLNYTATLPNGVTVELVGLCEHPSEGKPWWRPDGSLLPESPYDDDFGRAFPKENQKGYKFAVKFSNMAGKNIDARIIPREFKTTHGGGLSGTSEKNGRENISYINGLPDETIVWLGTALDEMFSHCDIRVGVCRGGWKDEYQYEKDQPNDDVEWVNFENVLLRPVPRLDTPVSSQPDIVPSNFKLQFNDYRGTHNLVVSVQNNGDAIIPKHRIRFYRGEPQQGLDETGHPHTGWHEAGPIEPGKTWNEATYGFHLQDGDYTFSVALDYDNAVAETDKTNNQKTIHVNVKNETVVEQSAPKPVAKKTWTYTYPNGTWVKPAAVFDPHQEPLHYWSPEGLPVNGTDEWLKDTDDIFKNENNLGVVLEYIPDQSRYKYTPASDGRFYEVFSVSKENPVIRWSHGYGDWQDVGAVGLNQVMMAEHDWYKLVDIKGVDGKNPILNATMYYNFNPAFGIRLIAIDKNGKEFAMKPETDFFGDFEKDRSSVYYDAVMGIGPATVKSFRVQKQKMDWAVIGGFAAEPNGKTNPEYKAPPLSHPFALPDDSSEWKTIAGVKENSSVSMGYFDKAEYTISRPVEKEQLFMFPIEIEVSDTLDRRRFETRMMAVKKNGTRITSRKNGTGGSTLNKAVYTFNGAPMEAYEEFCFQIRDTSTVPAKLIPCDLEPADFTMEFDAQRKTHSLVVSIKNHGEVTLPKHKIRYYQGDPAQGLDETGHPHTGWHEAGPIEPGKEWNESTYGFHLQDGDYTFSVALDYDNAVAETNETNNQKTIHVKVRGDQVTSIEQPTPADSGPAVSGDPQKPQDAALTTPSKLSGQVVSMDGKAADGAVVAYASLKRTVTLTSGGILSVKENGKHMDAIVHTGADGRFDFDVWPFEGFTLVVTHPDGWAMVHSTTLADNPQVMLKAWGSVHGNVAAGRAPAGTKIILSGFPNSTWLEHQIDFRVETAVDANGQFLFNQLPAGWYEAGYLVEIGRGSGSVTSRTPVEVQSGQVSQLRLGGEGRPVVGRFVVPPEYDAKPDFADGIRSFAMPYPRPDNYKQLTSEERQQCLQWRHYAFMIEEDGTFRIEDVIGSTYKFYVLLGDPSAEKPEGLGGYYEQITVPAPDPNDTETPFDLGELTLKMPAANSD